VGLSSLAAAVCLFLIDFLTTFSGDHRDPRVLFRLQPGVTAKVTIGELHEFVVSRNFFKKETGLPVNRIDTSGVKAGQKAERFRSLR
jgi:hypothetical protein